MGIYWVYMWDNEKCQGSWASWDFSIYLVTLITISRKHIILLKKPTIHLSFYFYRYIFMLVLLFPREVC
jgi:hypothetical protein